MKVALITLNFNGAESTIKLLESLQNQTDSDFSVIVADNSSEDIQKLQDYCIGKPIKIIRNGANLGFAGGVNPSLAQAFNPPTGGESNPASLAGAGWAVLINNDTWVESDFVACLKANLSVKRGIVGLPLNEGGRTAYAGQIDWLKPTLEHVYERPYGNENDLYPIGGGLAISKEAYAKLGGLDKKYFLYFEDADYAEKARQENVPVEFISEPIIHHTVAGTTGKMGSPILLRYHYRNALYFNFKNAPLLRKVLAIFWSVLIFTKQILKIIIREHTTESRAIMAGVVDFYQERMGYISKKIKVGIECEQIEGEIWGVGKMVTKLLENIASRPELKQDFEFHLYFKEKIPQLPFLDNPIFHKKIIDQPFRHKSFVAYYYVLLPIQLWFERLDVMFFPNYMLPIIFFGHSMVMLTEDIYYEMRSKQQRPEHRLAYRVFATWATWRAKKIMAISETSKKELAKLFDIDPKRIFVNPLGIDISEPTGENNHGQYLLFVGQAFPRRHLEESLLAFEKLVLESLPTLSGQSRGSSISQPNQNDLGEIGTELKFIAVGPDKYNPPKIRQLRQDINFRLGSERVIWYDRVTQEELNRLYSHAQAVIYISSREAFGLPPLEGLAQGSVPVVADNALSREIFGDNAFFVVNPDSIDSISKVLREAMTNSSLREKIKEHASEIVSRYSWQAHTGRFLHIIKALTHHD